MDTWTNSPILHRMHPMTEKCLNMIDAVFQCTRIFSQECEESLLNGTSDLWILRCFTHTPKLLGFATRLTIEEKISSQHFTAFLVQKLRRTTWRTSLRNLFWHGCCKIVISTTVTYDALVDTCCMSRDLAGTIFMTIFDWRLGTANRLVTRNTWLFTRCGNYRTPGCRSRRWQKVTSIDAPNPWSSLQKSSKCPKQQTPVLFNPNPLVFDRGEGLRVQSKFFQRWPRGVPKNEPLEISSTQKAHLWCTPLMCTFHDLHFGHP